MLTSFFDWLKMIKVEHTLFSLPFVIVAALLSLYELSLQNLDAKLFFWHVFTGNEVLGYSLWVFVYLALCLLAARSLGMSLNRIFDAEIDALNPRTQNREIPQNKISKTQAWIFSFLALVVLIFSALQLPSICIKLLPIALVFLFGYSWMKRLSYICHFVLGITLAGASLGAWIAVSGCFDSLAAIYLSLAVCFWVSGFDIIYSTQDSEFDKTQNLHSIPVAFGKTKALLIAKTCHFLMPLFLYLCGQELGLGLFYKLGVLAVIIALYYEHQLVKEDKIDQAFFTVNSWISVIFMLFVFVEFL